MIRHKKRFALFVLLLLLVSEYVFHFGFITTVKATGITRVQGPVEGNWSSGTSFAVTITPTSGNLLIAVITTRSGATPVTVSSISQNSVTWSYQIRKYYVYGTTQSWNVEIWVGVVSGSPSSTVTISLSGTPSGPYPSGKADICEYSGLLTSGFLDKTATNNGNSASTSTGTTASTTQADELWIGGINEVGVGSQSNPTNGFTMLVGASSQLGYLEKIVSATGTANSGTTISSDYWVGCIVTLKSITGYALNLCVKDWDLTDAISGAIVYKDTDTKTSNGGGWANWTGVSGTVAVKVKYFGFWVNGTSITVSADTTKSLRCKLYDVTVTAKPNNEIGVISGANVTAYNNTGTSNGKIKSGITASITGQVTLTNVPNATLRFIMYAKSDYSIIIANTTQLISSDDYAFNIVANQNYVVATLSFGYEAIIWMSTLSVLHLLALVSIIIHKKLKKRIGR
jgi:hypothetical protein